MEKGGVSAMSEIRDKVTKSVENIVKQAFISGYNAKCNGEIWEQEDGSVKLPEPLILLDTLDILSIPELAIVDRGAKVPQRKVLGSKGSGCRDTYMQGEIDAQGEILKDGYVKEVKE